MKNVISESSSVRPVRIAGIGSYTPERVVTNQDLEKMVDTSDEWILARTGIRERHIAADDEACSDMAVQAAERALVSAGIEALEVDLILLATCTPDHMFPNTASLVQHRIGATNAFCMDLGAACTGFLYALETGRQFVTSGSLDTVLVIGSEKMSSIVNWDDRQTCVLFGDAAGAAILQVDPDGVHGMLGSRMRSDGSLSELLTLPSSGSRLPVTAETLAAKQTCLHMGGREVFKHAVTNMAQTAEKLVASAGLVLDDVACIIPHQANRRILSAVAAKLGVDEDVVFVNVDKYGNTSAASIALALDEAASEGRIKKGDKVLLVAFGAGFTWGASLIEWRI